jgi:hypothetical protein
MYALYSGVARLNGADGRSGGISVAAAVVQQQSEYTLKDTSVNMQCSFNAVYNAASGSIDHC